MKSAHRVDLFTKPFAFAKPFASVFHILSHPPVRAFTALHCPPPLVSRHRDQSLLAPAYNPPHPPPNPFPIYTVLYYIARISLRFAISPYPETYTHHNHTCMHTYRRNIRARARVREMPILTRMRNTPLPSGPAPPAQTRGPLATAFAASAFAALSRRIRYYQNNASIGPRTLPISILLLSRVRGSNTHPVSVSRVCSPSSLSLSLSSLSIGMCVASTSLRNAHMRAYMHTYMYVHTHMYIPNA